MSTLCFGTFFTLLCGNKKDWDKQRRAEVSNRVLYFALLDIVDKNASKPHRHVDKAKPNANPGYKDDTASDAKTCKRDDHHIQRDGCRQIYIKRFENEHHAVLTDFVEYIKTYLDDKQHGRLALSVLELIIKGNISDNTPFYIGDNANESFEKKTIADDKRDYNLPSLLAGIMYYIIKENIPNGSADAQGTIDGWKTDYTVVPRCPVGESLGLDYVIDLKCEVTINDAVDELSEIVKKQSSTELKTNEVVVTNADIFADNIIKQIHALFPNETELCAFAHKTLDVTNAFVYLLSDKNLDNLIENVLMKFSKDEMASPELLLCYLYKVICLLEKDTQLELLSECIALKAKYYGKQNGRGNELLSELLAQK